MDTILKYLQNPMEKGVYNQIVKISFENLEEYADKEEDLSFMGSEYEEFKFTEIVTDVVCNKNIPEFYTFFSLEKSEFENNIKREVKPGDELSVIRYDEYWDVVENTFESRIKKNPLDVIIFDDVSKPLRKNKYLRTFEITTIKKISLEHFEQFIRKTPIGKSFEILKDRFTHSSRYVYRPYALAMETWFKDDSSEKIPKDLIDLLSAATDYYTNEEWRTSVTLSAIVTESILADVYEEEKKSDAPDVPLGNLFEEVKKVGKIPKDVQSAVKNVNQARIAAVHRSKSPVSDRDAEIALYGTIKTLIWFINKY